MKRRVTIIYECGAPDDVFKSIDEIGKERYEEITMSLPNGLPCDGGGVPGTWCRGVCHWSVSPLVVEDEVNWDEYSWNDR